MRLESECMEWYHVVVAGELIIFLGIGLYESGLA